MKGKSTESVSHTIIRGFNPACVSTWVPSGANLPPARTLEPSNRAQPSPSKPRPPPYFFIGDLSDSDSSEIDELVENKEEDSDDEEWESSDDSSSSEIIEFHRRDPKDNSAQRRSLLTMGFKTKATSTLGNRALLSALAIQRSQALTLNRLPTSKSSRGNSGLTMRYRVPRVRLPIIGEPRAHSLVLSPRNTRRNMLQAELTQSLRQNLVWERQGMNPTFRALESRWRTATSAKGIPRNGYEDYFDKGLLEYHQKGW